MSNQSDLAAIREIIERLDNARVARLGYTQEAFDSNDIEGVETFDFDQEQNIPLDSKTDYPLRVQDKGIQSQGASIPRQAWNHYIGRSSFNLDKTVQKLLSLLNLFGSALAHNAAEYDTAAQYKQNDICYLTSVVNSVHVYTWYKRVTDNPVYIQGISPADGTPHWKLMQESTSYDSELPFISPGYKRKYTVIDLTLPAYNFNKWYPVVSGPFNAGAEGNSAVQVLFEAFCSGHVQGHTEDMLGELAVLSRFTGFAETSTDIILNSLFMSALDGEKYTDSPIGCSKLPGGKQAVLWLRGGTKYYLWNSFGSGFTLYTGTYNNGIDPAIAPLDARPVEITLGTVSARVRTPPAEQPLEAPNLEQITGAYPLPIELKSGDNLRVIRRPGKYVALTPGIGNSVSDVPPQAPQPGIFDLTVKGDRDGAVMTSQQVMIRSTGNEYTRVLAGGVVVIDWYKSKSPTGLDIIGADGICAFRIEVDGHLYMYYGPNDEPPPVSIDQNPDSATYRHLIWEVNT